MKLNANEPVALTSLHDRKARSGADQQAGPIDSCNDSEDAKSDAERLLNCDFAQLSDLGQLTDDELTMLITTGC